MEKNSRSMIREMAITFIVLKMKFRMLSFTKFNFKLKIKKCDQNIFRKKFSISNNKKNTK